MKATLLKCILIILMGAVAGPALADDSEAAAFKQAIRAKYDLKEQAFAAGDADLVVDRFYSEDVISTDNEGNTHVGREELRPLYEEVTAAFNAKIESVYTHVNGDAGWDWANFHVTPKDPDSEVEPFSFKILFLWEKVNGEWWSKGDMYVLGRFEQNDEH
ncbi:MAG: nuclear transport factor 2 family protein [Gammaproteobacteria bacterium]